MQAALQRDLQAISAATGGIGISVVGPDAFDRLILAMGNASRAT